jgi:hypothetical protein
MDTDERRLEPRVNAQMNADEKTLSYPRPSASIHFSPLF